MDASSLGGCDASAGVLPPADKYRIEAEVVVRALAERCSAPLVAIRNLYLQFVFAWLTGNGDLHAKNVAIVGRNEVQEAGVGFGAAVVDWTIAPVYDVPSTLIYDDDSLRAPDRRADDETQGAALAGVYRSDRAAGPCARSAEVLALRAAAEVDLAAVGFEGSPLRRVERELGFRRAELSG